MDDSRTNVEGSRTTEDGNFAIVVDRIGGRLAVSTESGE